MPEISLPPFHVTARTKLTVEINPELAQDLERYRAFYKQAYGADVLESDLLREMARRFMDGDREFQVAKYGLKARSRAPPTARCTNNGADAKGGTMIAATATFAVLKRQPSPTTIQVVTILTGLADIQPHDAIAPALPTYDEAVRIATERGLSREPRIGFLKQFGVAEFVPVSERIVCGTAEELDSLAAAMS